MLLLKSLESSLSILLLPNCVSKENSCQLEEEKKKTKEVRKWLQPEKDWALEEMERECRAKYTENDSRRELSPQRNSKEKVLKEEDKVQN